MAHAMLFLLQVYNPGEDASRNPATILDLMVNCKDTAEAA